MVSQKFTTKFKRHFGRAGERMREPESRKNKTIWIPVFPGMTTGGWSILSMNL
jgi:hypothetical protein